MKVYILTIAILLIGCGQDETPNQKAEAQIKETPEEEVQIEADQDKSPPAEEAAQTNLEETLPEEEPKEPWILGEELIANSDDIECPEQYHPSTYHEFEGLSEELSDITQEGDFYWFDDSGYTYEKLESGSYMYRNQNLDPEPGYLLCVLDDEGELEEGGEDSE